MTGALDPRYFAPAGLLAHCNSCSKIETGLSNFFAKTRCLLPLVKKGRTRSRLLSGVPGKFGSIGETAARFRPCATWLR
ncbi:hypothetical protein [Burkholderia sp. LAS2]|uniref:hypothetical protein n=1 Tax=Burkholderia sp. LAS2 TaxID=2813843 RepID=UPI001BCC764F|nr:hypothetical protein [Burkholderia sp. LAS2]QVN14135.1 hypothetical protein JYG37_27150 [Burkholderia sp. LAS2]